MITTDAEALEARYAGKSQSKPQPRSTGEPPPLYAPGFNTPPDKQGQIPMGTPVPEGVVIEQRVGRAMAPPSMAVVPPQAANQGPQPSIMVVPPTDAGRTTIGTFVESARYPNGTVSPSKTNPLVEEEPAPAPKPTAKKLDLVQAILDHMHELGGWEAPECQKFYDKSVHSLRKYVQDPASIPLSCVLKFLGKRPGVMAQIAEELEPHFAANGKEGWVTSLPNRGKTDVMVCAAVLERPTLPFMWACLYLAKKYELGFTTQADTMIVRSRNVLAQRFLASGATWSLWIDGDMACPIANADWYKWITGTTTVPDEGTRYDFLARLLGHGKAVAGAVYASRKYHGSLVIQPEIHPRGPEDKLLSNEIRRGTARGLAAVDWVGFGCALVHREVFLELQRRFPELAPQSEFSPWRFFQPLADEGEDQAFCTRVRRCDIPIWLDTQLVCGHIGSMAFMPEHTMALPTL
jgi:hypothetical protein